MLAAFLLAQGVAILAGTIVLLVLGARLPLGLWLPTAWLAGTGALAAEHLVLAQLQVPWTPLLLALPWLPVAGLVGWRAWATRAAWWPDGTRAAPATGRRRVPAGALLDLGVAGLIAGWVAGLGWQAINEPLAGWDAWAMWFLKGRALYLENTLPLALFTDTVHYGYYAHLDYPLFVPLTIAQTYAWTGDSDPLMKGWWPLLAGAAAAGLYWGLAGFAGRAARLGGIVFIVLLPDLTRHAAAYYAGYADLPLAVSFLYGALFLYRWLKRPAPPDFYLAALFFCLAGFTKNEGLVMTAGGLAVLLGLSLARRRLTLLDGGVLGLLGAGIVAPWQWEIARRGIAGDIQPTWAGVLAQGATRLGPALQSMTAIAADPRYQNLLWPALPLLGLGALVFTPRRWLATLPLLLLVAMQVSATLLAYVVSPHDLAWHLQTSVDRVIFQPSLVALLLSTIYLGLLLDRQEPQPPPRPAPVARLAPS